jgi:hypothetical protein
VERAARAREEQLRDAYEHARRQEAHRLIAGTPPEELSAIEQEATAPWKREHGALDRSGFPPFEPWRVHLSRGDFDPSDCGF